MLSLYPGTEGAWKYYALTFPDLECADSILDILQYTGGRNNGHLGNAFQMFSIFAVFRRVKRWILRKENRNLLPIYSWPLYGSPWEFFYFDAEISFPWLVLGNGFATNVSLVQWYEMTGVLGGSLWI